MTRPLLAVIALVVPAVVRPRWREEWGAELAEVRRTRGRLAAGRMLSGAVADARTLRTLDAARRKAARGGPFAAFDQDIRYAVRGLLHAPGFTAGIIVSLALGLAATAAAFSFLNAAFYRGFPEVADQRGLVRLTLGRASYQKFSSIATPYRDYLTLRDNLTTLQGLAAYRDATFAVLAGDQPLSVRGALVSSNYFRVLGIPPAAGRFFIDDEDRTPDTHPVVVISDMLWERLFNRSPSAIGSVILVNGAPLHIVGVTPPAFIGIRRAENPARLWVPAAMSALTLRDHDGHPAAIESAGPLWLDLVGRRLPNVSVEQVQAQAAGLRDSLDATRPDPRARISVIGVWLNNPEGMEGEMLAFMAIPLLVLAIACVNAANLMFARAARSVSDWVVRLAVGATRWRIVRQVLTEAILLSLLSAAFGLLIARWGLSIVERQMPVPMPIDARVALFTLAVVVITAVTFSLGPAWNVTRRATARLSRMSGGAAGRVRSRTRFALVVLQAALSLGLLATGAQFTRTIQARAAGEHIPSPETLVIASINVDPLRLAPEAGEHFYARLLERVRRIPGVKTAAVVSNGLITGTVGRDGVTRAWTDPAAPDGAPVTAFSVTPDVFAAVGVQVKPGRGFDASDTAAARAVVVNATFAKTLLNGQGVGRLFRLGRPAAPPADGIEPGMVIISNGVPAFRGAPKPSAGNAVDVTVVGVVDRIMKGTGEEPAIVYYPSPLVYQPARSVYLRLDDTRTFSAAGFHAAVRDVDARVPVVDLATLADIRMRKDQELKMLTRAAALLGILALALAAGGLYSVVSYVVSLRWREMGIRLALGAGRGAIVAMILKQALAPTFIGAGIGAGTAAIAGAVIRSRMYGATPVDPAAFGGATLLMVAVMAAASWWPARQAARVDPVRVLRQD
jgi:predicted permease